MSSRPGGSVSHSTCTHICLCIHIHITYYICPYQALFCRDKYGNGWEFGPASTYEGATRLFPPYLAPADPTAGARIGWGG
jgi:hypothetical protein